MNCTCRGKPVPVFGDALLSLLLLKFKVELMIPKPPLGVTGEYKKIHTREKSYPNLHGVEWLKRFPHLILAGRRNCTAGP